MKNSVLVVGAGMSGLSAAQTLYKEGLDVCVLEATPRIGGRVYTDHSFAKYPVELGAEFIHDPNNPIMRKIIDELHLQTYGDTVSCENFVLEDGVLVKDPLPDELLNTLVYAAEQHLLSGGKDMSIATFVGTSKALEMLFPGSEAILNSMISSEYGNDIDTVGLRGLIELDFSGYDGLAVHLCEGLSPILDHLQKDIAIHTERVVQKISWNNVIEVTCESGTEYSADYCIVTVPVSLLQKNAIVFDPPLSEEKKSAIQAVGCSHTLRILLKFSEAWWPENFGTLLLPSPTQVWWRPGFERSDEEPILTALVGGKSAKMLGLMEEKCLIDFAIADLENSWHLNLRSLLTGHKIFNWSAEPFAGMGYSYLPFGVRSDVRDVYASRAGNLHFAGEATVCSHSGTVHGAIESGIRAAEEILHDG